MERTRVDCTEETEDAGMWQLRVYWEPGPPERQGTIIVGCMRRRATTIRGSFPVSTPSQQDTTYRSTGSRRLSLPPLWAPGADTGSHHETHGGHQAALQSWTQGPPCRQTPFQRLHGQQTLRSEAANQTKNSLLILEKLCRIRGLQLTFSHKNTKNPN